MPTSPQSNVTLDVLRAANLTLCALEIRGATSEHLTLLVFEIYMHGQHTKELNSGKRFAFGSNWAKFLRGLNETRIVEAELSLQRMLKVDHLRGKRVLDVV